MALLWVAVLVIAAMGLVRPWSTVEQSAGPTRTVVVGAGDTLWELAGQARPQVDRRSTVASIVEINDLASAGDVHPGDRLLIPAG